ncbi:hypothetical protein IPZ68_32025 [Streptomyces arenae]|nr:hypothetical protein [Streptomyces arenae]
MTSVSAAVAVPSGAVVRFVRATAGRRALHVVLVLGGLIVLGLLFGGRAQAADGLVGDGDAVPAGRTQPLKRATEPVSEPAATPVAESAAEPVARTVRHAAEPVTEPAVRPAARPVVRPAVRPVVRPVRDVVNGVAGSLDKAPDPAGLLPDRGALPGSGDGDDDGAGRGSGAEPVPGHEEAKSPGTAGKSGDAASERERQDERRPVGPRVVSTLASASWWADGQSVRHGDARGGPVAGEFGTGRPSLPVPASPGRSVVNATASDGGSSRHGDLHAAAFGGRAPVRYLSGPGFGPDHAPTRDRHRDIPEFPG